MLRRLKREINARTNPPRFCTRRPPQALVLQLAPQEVALATAFDAFRAAIRLLIARGVTPDLEHVLEGPTLFEGEDLQKAALAAHAGALATLSRLHELPVQDAAERSRIYRDELLRSETYMSLKGAMDLWCACWFWLAERLEHVPLPSTFHRPSESVRAIVARLASEKRFFHWELEFPDVFRISGSGFDAVLGNPPWDIAKPNSKEFFSRYDPLYRGLGSPEARQRELFQEKDIEEAWLLYNDEFNARSNFVRYAAGAYGDPEVSQKSQDRFPLGHGHANLELHARWREVRSRARGFADSEHPFRWQGGADLNLYKLFLEQMHHLLRIGGRVGVVLPSAIYNDAGASRLRALVVETCELDWLFGFENRKRIFPIDSRVRFCCLVASRGSSTTSVRTAFGRQDIADWEVADRITLRVARTDLHLFSPKSRAIPEIEHGRDVEILRTIYSNSVLLDEGDGSAWSTRYVAEFHMTSARKKGLFEPFDKAVGDGSRETRPGHWSAEEKQLVALYTGKMIAQYDFAYQEWLSGHGNHAKWRELPFSAKHWKPEFVMPIQNTAHRWTGGTRLAFRDITNATNERTVIAAIIPAWPCGNKVPFLADEGLVSLERQLALCAIMNSFVYDWVVRVRMTGINLNKFIITETPVPAPRVVPAALALLSARLCMTHRIFAKAWLDLLDSHPSLGVREWERWWAKNSATRLACRVAIESIVATLYGLSEAQFRWILRNCDYPSETLTRKEVRRQLPAKGFWRVGIGSAEHEWNRGWLCEPEVRLPVLAIVAFMHLQEDVRTHGGDVAAAVRDFAGAGDGWLLPTTLILDDYGLGRDMRAKSAQPVQARFTEGREITANPSLTWSDCRRLAEELKAAWTSTPPAAVGPRASGRAPKRQTDRQQRPLFGDPQ